MESRTIEVANKRIVIIGAGFAGLNCALKLASSAPHLRIALINKTTISSFSHFFTKSQLEFSLPRMPPSEELTPLERYERQHEKKSSMDLPLCFRPGHALYGLDIRL